MNIWWIVYMINQLFDWLTTWLINYLIDWLMVWLSDQWFFTWLNYQLIDWSNDRLFSWFNENFIDYWVDISIDLYTCSCLSLDTPPTLCESFSSEIRSPFVPPKSKKISFRKKYNTNTIFKYISKGGTILIILSCKEVPCLKCSNKGKK